MMVHAYRIVYRIIIIIVLSLGLFFLSIVIGLYFYTNYSNNICYNSNNKSVYSCDAYITYLTIERNGTNRMIIKNVNLDSAKKEIPLFKSINGYDIKSEGDVFTLENKFFSNSLYIITNSSIGDADASSISFETDSMGIPILTNQYCNCQ